MFSGSYHADDVIFLLKPVQMSLTPVAEKERLIQSRTRHYSEMLSPEALPSGEYLRLFHEALARHQRRFARDLMRMARRITELQSGPITLVSLARAGTPIGAMLKRVLQRQLGRSASHYSISLIRDRGIDTVALRFLLRSHAPSSIVFVDGWTGKGVMSRELHQAVESFHASDNIRLNSGLHVIADLSGTATEAATSEDYLIPSSLLGATISGLVSRSILNTDVVGADDFHGCVHFSEFTEHDLTGWFLDVMTTEIERQWSEADAAGEVMTDAERQRQRVRCRDLLTDVAERFGIHDANHIKPGIGEATRVMLRRIPSHLLLRDAGGEDVRHLRELAERRSVAVLVDRDLPYHAVALIRNLDKGDS